MAAVVAVTWRYCYKVQLLCSLQPL